MNGSRLLIAKSWFLNNIKYAQDWMNKVAKQVYNKSYSSPRGGWRYEGTNHWRKVEKFSLCWIQSIKSPIFGPPFLSHIGFLFRVKMICNIPISFLGFSECIFSLLITYFILFNFLVINLQVRTKL